MKKKIAATFVTGLGLIGAGSAPAQLLVNGTLLNVASQGGSVNSVVASSAIFGLDDPTEAFGSPTGPVENGTFLFADNGFGGTETLTFSTASAVTFAGLQISGGGAGSGAGDPRTISSIVFRADTNGDSVFDFTQTLTGDYPEATTDYPFSQSVTGTLFQLEFGTPEQGSRVTEVDALVVPEPASLGLLGLSAVGLLARRRR